MKEKQLKLKEIEEIEVNDRLFAEFLQNTKDLDEEDALNMSINLREKEKPRVVAYPAKSNWQRKVYGAG